MFIRSLVMAEYKADGYVLHPQDFRILSFDDPPMHATDLTIKYLIRCCLQVNNFFTGTFEFS